ncbi:hypothetical protein OUZ56_017778 [Daphnia magna]|uniref:Uncharacterized protein n=1 Tax=Daphnia magna TaxID=35525 RepID=A0ABR0ATR6_9CRUS|nr:hypothetical protein OUZ56_017778 [Daphnia magna]
MTLACVMDGIGLALVADLEFFFGVLVVSGVALTERMKISGLSGTGGWGDPSALITVDWSPTDEEFRSVVEFKNLRMKNQAKYKENGGTLEFFELTENNGRPFIRPTSASSTLHTTGQRLSKQTTSTPDPKMVAEAVSHHPISKAAKRRSRSRAIYYGYRTQR